jgi:EF hand domain-containing protein
MNQRIRQGALLAVFALGSAVALAQTAAAPAAPAPDAQDVRARIGERFSAADADHNGKLTREEATAKMPMVARNFDQIDKSHKGFVTLDDVQTFARERAAARKAAKVTPAT